MSSAGTSPTAPHGFRSALREHFPAAVPLGEFADRTVDGLGAHGFRAENCLLLLGACRDELSGPVFVEMQRRWGSAFGIAGLAGMLFLGRTGIAAARHHIPDTDGVERYVSVVTTHIGIHEDGTLGLCQREGQRAPSSACGALVGFRTELVSGHIHTDMDPDDTEMSLLRLRLLRELRYGEVPSMAELTRTTLAVIMSDFRRLARAQAVPDERTHSAALGGIVIHGPDGDWVEPGPGRLRTGSRASDLTL